jgi:hypothetical protein
LQFNFFRHANVAQCLHEALIYPRFSIRKFSQLDGSGRRARHFAETDKSFHDFLELSPADNLDKGLQPFLPLSQNHKFSDNVGRIEYKFPNGKTVFFPFASHKGNYFADLWMQQKTVISTVLAGVPNDNFWEIPDFAGFLDYASPQQ